MAYSGVATVVRYTVSARRHFLVTVVETECAAASEYTITGLPELVTIASCEVTKTAGAATSFGPIVGKATAPADGVQNHIRTYPSASLHIHDESAVRAKTADGILYVRTSPNAAADNSISTTWLFIEGHDSGQAELQPVYNATPATRAEGRRGPVQAESDGSLRVTLAKDIRGENSTTKRLDVSVPHSTAIMTGATTTTHLTGAGRFRGVRIGKDVALGVITVYDNTAGSGTILFKYTALAAAVAVPPSPCDIPVATGITVVTSAAFDVMIDWNANP